MSAMTKREARNEAARWTATSWPKLCPACSTGRDRWLDTKPSTLIPRFVQRAVSGYGYDATAAGVRDGTRAHFEDWRRLVNFQIGLIEKQCAAGHLPTAQPKHLDLFASQEVAG